MDNLLYQIINGFDFSAMRYHILLNDKLQAPSEDDLRLQALGLLRRAVSEGLDYVFGGYFLVLNMGGSIELHGIAESSRITLEAQ